VERKAESQGTVTELFGDVNRTGWTPFW